MKYDKKFGKANYTNPVSIFKKVILALFFNFGSFYKTNFCSSFWFRLKSYANDFLNKLMAINSRFTIHHCDLMHRLELRWASPL